MALAYGNLDALSHQLRFLLFEIGIGLPQSSIDYFITLAHQNTLKRLEQAILAEGLTRSPIISHHVHDFMEQLRAKLKQSEPASLFYQWNNLKEELDESIANEALALAYNLRWNSQIRNEVRSHDSLWSWIKNEHTVSEALSFLEQWGCQGHPSHPAFRAKIGFTRREVLQNSAEFQAKIHLHWCALRKNKIITSANLLDFKASMALNFPNEIKRWQEHLALNHLAPQEYIPIPVHPWQWRNKLQTPYSHLTDDKSLILLPHHQIVMPSMSEGIMMPVNQSNPYIKLPIDIATPYAPKLAIDEQSDDALMQWVHFLLEQTEHYQHTLFLASKLSSINIYPSSIYPYYQQQLSVSFLRNPTNLIRSDQKIVPLSSLFTCSPITNKPLLIEIIQSSGLAPIAYFQLYCHKVLFSQLHLLVKHGIAFEIQHQNTLIVFSDDVPQGVLIRDHGKIRVSYADLFENKEKVDSSSSTLYKNSPSSELHHHFIQGALQNNLGYWIKTLNQEYRLDTQQLWAIVNQMIHSIFNELSKEMPNSSLNQQKQQLLSRTWQHQCVLTMKLKGNTNTAIYTDRTSPFNI